jgi:hypothetical protein
MMPADKYLQGGGPPDGNAIFEADSLDISGYVCAQRSTSAVRPTQTCTSDEQPIVARVQHHS